MLTEFYHELNTGPVQIYSLVASSLLIYDHCLTLTEEIDLVWSCFTRVRVLTVSTIVMNRYISLTFGLIAVSNTLLSPPVSLFREDPGEMTGLLNRCNILLSVQIILAIIIRTIAEVLLLIRARAVARCSLVTFLLTLHVVAQLGVSLYLAIQYILEVYPSCIVCLPRAFEHLTTAYLALLLSFDGIAVTAVLATTRTPSLLSTRSSLLATISRDSFLYFVAIFTSNLIWMVLILSTHDTCLSMINAQPSFIFTALLTNRLYFSLRHASQKELDQLVSTSGVLDLEFHIRTLDTYTSDRASAQA